MLKPSRHKKKQPPIEISNNKSTSTFTFSAPSPFFLAYLGQEKKEDILSLLPKKKTKNL